MSEQPGETGPQESAAPWPENFVEMSPDGQLAAFLSRKRADAPAQDRRRGKGISGEQMASELDVSVSTYWNLETSGAGKWTSERASGAAEVLDLNPAERIVFYTMALGYDRPELLGVPSVGAPVRKAVDGIELPAVFVDPCTKILHRNEAMAHWMPELQVGSLFARWVLCDNSTRDRLPRWRCNWAAAVVDCLIASQVEAHPDWVAAIAVEANSIRTLAQNPEVEEIWQLRESGRRVPEEAPGQEPDLRGPVHQLLRMESLGVPGHRLLVVVPSVVADGEI